MRACVYVFVRARNLTTLTLHRLVYQSYLNGTHSKVGRPCCLAIQSVTLKGAFSPDAQVHVEVGLSPGEHEQNLLTSPLPPLATPPRLPVAAGEIDQQGRVDHVLIPSVTATSTLLFRVCVDNQPVASLRYPLAEVTVTLRPTELRLTPGTHGDGGAGTPPRSHARRASGVLRSPFGGRRRSESPKPPPALSSSPPPAPDATMPAPASPPAGTASASGAAAAADTAAASMPTLGAVWGELSFFDNRT
jgi:hypothetical protein